MTPLLLSVSRKGQLAQPSCSQGHVEPRLVHTSLSGTEIWGSMPGEDGGRDWGLCGHKSKNSSHQKLDEVGKDSPQEPFGGREPLLVTSFWFSSLQNCERQNFWCLRNRFAMICCESSSCYLWNLVIAGSMKSTFFFIKNAYLHIVHCHLSYSLNAISMKTSLICLIFCPWYL